LRTLVTNRKLHIPAGLNNLNRTTRFGQEFDIGKRQLTVTFAILSINKCCARCQLKRRKVGSDDIASISAANQSALSQHVCSTAQARDGRHVVTHEQNSSSVSRHFSHFAQTFFLESNVADG